MDYVWAITDSIWITLTEAEFSARSIRRAGIINTDGIDECANTYIAHPMTGMQFRGVQIPFWEEICALCKEASQALPCLRVVGWDVAILSDGRLELIEGNHSPGMNIVQGTGKARCA